MEREEKSGFSSSITIVVGDMTFPLLGSRSPSGTFEAASLGCRYEGA